MTQQRLTISLDAPLAEAIDAFAERRGYASRSEAMRDLLREALLAREGGDAPGGEAVAAVSYVVEREQAQRLAEARLERHDLVLGTLQAPLGHRHAVEVVLLRGPAAEVRALADRATGARGVRFGRANVVPLAAQGRRHRHGPGGEEHAHAEPTL